MQTPKEKKLKTLLKRQLDLDTQIKNAREEIEQEARALRKRKAIIIGQVILELVEEGVWSEEQLTTLLNPKVLLKRQRALFGLDTKKAEPTTVKPMQTQTQNPALSLSEIRTTGASMRIAQDRQMVMQQVQEKVAMVSDRPSAIASPS